MSASHTGSKRTGWRWLGSPSSSHVGRIRSARRVHRVRGAARRAPPCFPLKQPDHWTMCVTASRIHSGALRHVDSRHREMRTVGMTVLLPPSSLIIANSVEFVGSALKLTELHAQRFAIEKLLRINASRHAAFRKSISGAGSSNGAARALESRREAVWRA